MTKLNITLDSTGPLINEDIGAWQGNNSILIAGQPQNFYDGTISLTPTNGGHAYIIFNGTGIYLYGTQGPLHGEYSVSIDEKVVYNGYSGRDQLLFQQLLYSNNNLTMGLHNVTLTNTFSNAARNLTDIDYFVWTTEIGAENSVISSRTIEWDNSTAWAYGGVWNATGTSSSLYPNFSSGARATNGADANATLTFEGDAVTVYGATSQLMGAYSVFLDLSSRVDYTGRHDEVNKEAMVFYADNLGPGEHRLTFVNNPSGTDVANTFLIEKAVVLTASGGSTATPTPTPGHHSKVGVIAGATIGGVAVVILGVLTLALVRRRRNDSTQIQPLAIDPPTTQLQFEPYIPGRVEPFHPNVPEIPSTSHPISNESTPSAKGQLLLSPGGSSLVGSSSTAAPSIANPMSEVADSEEPPPGYSS